MEFGIDAEELVHAEIEREDLQFQVNALNANKTLLLGMNHNLQLIANNLLNRESAPQGTEKRWEAAMGSLSGHDFQGKLAKEKQECLDAMIQACKITFNKNKMSNVKAHELFLALLNNASEIYGSAGFGKLRSTIRSYLGPALTVGNAPLELDNFGLPAVQVAASQDPVPCELVASHIRTLKDTSFDFVITDSEISRRLASELQVPSFSDPDLKPETETRIPWRCCPAVEIDLLKLERSEHADAYQKLLATFAEHVSPEKSQGNYSEDVNLQLQRIDLLINHVGTMQDCINSFFNAILVHYPGLDISLNPGQYGLQTFIIVQKLIDDMAKNNRFVSNRFDEVRKFGCDVATYFPEVQYGEIGIHWARPSWFSGLLDGIKASVRAKEDLNKEAKSLQKSI